MDTSEKHKEENIIRKINHAKYHRLTQKIIVNCNENVHTFCANVSHRFCTYYEITKKKMSKAIFCLTYINFGNKQKRNKAQKRRSEEGNKEPKTS